MSKKKTTTKQRAERTEQEGPASATPLLNERLRKQGKWIFAALAIIFALMFVVAGVGTGGPSMLDLLDDERAAEVEVAPEGSELQKAVIATEERPDDPQAWIELAQARVNADEPAEAVEAAEKAAELAPDDAQIQQEVADVYLAQAAAVGSEAQKVYDDVGTSGATTRPVVPTVVIIGQTSGSDAFRTAIETVDNQRFQAAIDEVSPLQQQAQEAYDAAVAALRTATVATPEDPALWFRLGQVAAAAGDNEAALEAYRTFVELVPNDPLVTQVNEEIDRLEGGGVPVG